VEVIKVANKENTPMVEDIYAGNYYDILGHRGEIRLTLQRNTSVTNGPRESSYNGTCELILTDADEPVVFRGTAQNLPSNFDGEQTPSGGTVQLTFFEYPDDVANSEITPNNGVSWTADTSILIQSASPFAKQAIYGTLGTPSGETGLGGGVWIAWQFADAE
jgi:hypothetical protein